VRSDQRDAEFSEYAAAERRRLLRTARLLSVGDEASAEELVQTTLTRLYVHWPKVRRAHDPVSYGLKALTNAFIDERRRAHWRREQLADAPDAGRGADPADGRDPDLRQAMLAALAGLPPRQRAVVVLRHWLDLDVAATASVLGCSTGTVKSQNAKALEHLRASIGSEVLTEGSSP
jgi:RNA polymerase sigma-70 factor (sigma-E family)